MLNPFYLYMLHAWQGQCCERPLQEDVTLAIIVTVSGHYSGSGYGDYVTQRTFIVHTLSFFHSPLSKHGVVGKVPKFFRRRGTLKGASCLVGKWLYDLYLKFASSAVLCTHRVQLNWSPTWKQLLLPGWNWVPAGLGEDRSPPVLQHGGRGP